MQDENPYRSNPALAEAEMAQSDRMRGNTTSVFNRAPRVGETWFVGRARPRVARNSRGREHHARSAGRPKAQATRSSARSGDSGDDSDPPGPPERRPCANKRCQADISHLHRLAEFCDNACKQAAYRDRLTHEHLDELVGTQAVGLSCKCSPKPHLVIGGVCFTCGKSRGVITCAWLDDDMRARSFVSSRAPARRNPRYGDRKRKPVREYVDRGAVAA